MNKCSIVKDLLPLYVDGVCSEESHRLITEHLKECKACRDELDMLSFDFKISSADEKEAVKKFKKKTQCLMLALKFLGICPKSYY